MNELDQALTDLQSIRRQVARATTFRGYGPLTLAGTSVLAVVAAWVQTAWVSRAAEPMMAYLAVWVGTAVVACGMIGREMWARTRRIHSGLANEMLLMAVEQFMPAMGVGALVTMTLVRFAPQAAWMLPGLWMVISALGIFASCRFLPKGMVMAGVWYVLAGVFALALGNGRALSPWTMGVGYGVGQMMFAAALWLAAREGQDGR